MPQIINHFCKEVGAGRHAATVFNRLTNCFYLPVPVKQTLPSKWADYYMKKVIPHKVEVFKAGMELKSLSTETTKEIRERLLFHDLSKFSKQETAYATHKFGKDVKNSDAQLRAFGLAFHHHKMNNDHHPEYWWYVKKDGSTKAVPMPHACVWEMIADWIGASRTYGNPLENWLKDNLLEFRFHHQTAQLVIKLLRAGCQIETRTTLMDNSKLVYVDKL